MKYYKLERDLPTFNRGELFYLDGLGDLVRAKDHLMAYSHITIDKFPNILKDWFIETPAPVRDLNTKSAFIEYIRNHREERFFQAVRNFTRKYLDGTVNFIAASDNIAAGSFIDTFHWECDEMLKEDDEI